MAGVREDLSESAKVARIGTWAAQLGLDAQETTAVLVEKYGPYAYDVMEAAVMKPSALMKNVGGRASSSKEAAEYMVKHIIPNESLAKVVNKDPAIIEAEMTRYRVEHPKEEETPEQREVRERQEQFNQHFNAEMERRGGAAMTVDPNTVDVSQMTLEDYAKYCKPEDRPAESYDALADAAYDDFAKGEGVCSQLYLDSMGYPTIGLGHLVFHPNYLDDPNQLRAARESYANLPLYGADGKPLSPEVKRRQFDAIKTAYQNKTFRTKGGCPNYVQIPITGTLKPEGIKQTFKQDFKYTYNTTKRVVPELDKMPLPVQLATLHMTFAYGNANKLKSVDVNSPVEVMNVVDRYRNKKGVSQGERATVVHGNDSIQVAQANYVQFNAPREMIPLGVVEAERPSLSSILPSVSEISPEIMTIRVASFQNGQSR